MVGPPARSAGTEEPRDQRSEADRRADGRLGAGEGLSEAELKAMFPDGKIPKTMPKRGIGAKFRRRGR